LPPVFSFNEDQYWLRIMPMLAKTAFAQSVFRSCYPISWFWIGGVTSLSRKRIQAMCPVRLELLQVTLKLLQISNTVSQL